MVLAFAACSGNAPSDDDDVTPDPFKQKGTYLTLTVAPQSASRSSRGPSGGEATVYEPALDNETAVGNATVFLYQAAEGVNAPASTPILFALYAPQFTKQTTAEGTNADVAYCSGLLKSDKDIPSGTYHILVVCNQGDISSCKTLGDVRSIVCTQTYKQSSATDPATASDFVMSSATDDAATLTGEGGPDNPVSINAHVQRLAARIDFGPGNATEETSKDITTTDGTTLTLARCYTYAVQNQDGTENGDEFLLTHVTPFNLLTSGTQLLKSVTASTATATPVYLGKETANANGEATNYVLDPWTFRKTSATLPDGLSYDMPYATVAKLTDENDILPLRPTTVKAASGLRYYILSYAQENTLSLDSPYETYATGIRVDGYYKKKGTSTYSAKTYYHFIRHADPHNTPNSIAMKYGIVRNTIYRLYVNRVTSLGVVLIQVTPWQHTETDEIQL